MDQNPSKKEETQEQGNLPEFNAWLTQTRAMLNRYSDGQKIEAVNFLYTDVYSEIETKVNAAKTTVTMLETTFSKLPFKVVK
jgi:hypothetical protein